MHYIIQHIPDRELVLNFCFNYVVMGTESPTYSFACLLIGRIFQTLGSDFSTMAGHPRKLWDFYSCVPVRIIAKDAQRVLRVFLEAVSIQQ